MEIAILGNGTVSKGVQKIVAQQNELNNKYVFVRSGKEQEVANGTSDYQDILNDSSVEVVVEALGGIDPAYQMIIEALKAKKNVVTANKAVVARYLKEFQEIANENQVHFYFESSVGGGIPWIKNLERVLRIDKVSQLSGIFNGTSNFILDKMYQSNASFSSVLKEAQDLGYAEADPSADIDGYDIENKLCISADLTYNTFLKPGDNLIKFGIRSIEAKDIQYFKKHDWKIKLIGQLIKKDHQISFLIEPTLYDQSSVMASIDGNNNYIELTGETIGKLGFMGQGAGMLPTSHAVVQDILDIYLSDSHLLRDFKDSNDLKDDVIFGDYLIRTKLDLSDFNLSEEITKDGNYWIFKDVNAKQIHNLVNKLKNQDENIFMARINGGE
ncbi:homoserine dehydrogenase [Lactobacillus sp. S2-2]|uniref:homoserine dehydrogenase n=1 Tax=Lactobacillus sp. S2-2 TaxID=2692917 RepID=UPI001F013E31|nr:homoserine dehydrogenase [Lactobacillus sp. S2-2]MCF6515361.1 homoserine dehydrogenase [Lactobacillus sp. S2-2]